MATIVEWIFTVGFLSFFTAAVVIGWSVYLEAAPETPESIWGRFWTPEKHIRVIHEHRRLHPESKSRKRMFGCYIAALGCLVGLVLTVVISKT